MEACCKKWSHKGFFSPKNKLAKMNYFKGSFAKHHKFKKFKKL